MATMYKVDKNMNNRNDIKRQDDVEAAIAKSMELRALHASLMHKSKNSPTTNNNEMSPASRFSPQDYPVFTPTYGDEPIRGYQNRNYTESWGDYSFHEGNVNGTAASDYRTFTDSSRKGLPYELGWQMSPAEDQYSVTGSYARKFSPSRASPRPNYSKSRRNSLGDMSSISSSNRCKSNIVVPMTDSHVSLHSQPRSKGLHFSWLFPGLKKKKNKKSENSPTSPNVEERSNTLTNLGLLSVETLKRELMEVMKSRDAALTEVSEMKSSVGELRQKLEYLETHCEELKKALRLTVKQRGKSNDGNSENSRHVNDNEMVEAFLQSVTESRLSVKRFCKILLGQIEETDHSLMDKLNLLLQPYSISLTSKRSKPVLYHLEAIINQSLYQDFENCVFQKNGAPNLLDPQQDRHTRFRSFVALRNLSWNQVLRKGTKYYSEEFSKFCDQKMSGIIATLGWTRPWPEQLLQAFFATAKCIWLLHLLAFSFDPPLSILRVDDDKPFEQQYMEDVSTDRQRSQCPSRAKVMVMPGFYVNDRVLKCKVLCKYM